MADENTTPVLPTVTSQKGATVGDENLPEPREADVTVEQRQDKAQVVAKPEPAPAKVEVFEVAVTTDTVITDPSDPLAVQIPDAGRGSLLLPIHQFIGAEHVEDIFARDGAAEDEAPAKSDDKS